MLSLATVHNLALWSTGTIIHLVVLDLTTTIAWTYSTTMVRCIFKDLQALNHFDKVQILDHNG